MTKRNKAPLSERRISDFLSLISLGPALLRDDFRLIGRIGTHTDVVVVYVIVVDVAVGVNAAGVVTVVTIRRPQPPQRSAITALSLYYMLILRYLQTGRLV